MSTPASTTPDRPKPSFSEIFSGALLALLAMLFWLAAWYPWRTLMERPSILDGLAMGVCAGVVMVAARWATNGPGRWWLRWLQALTFLAVIVSGSYQVHFHWFMPAELELDSEFVRQQLSVIAIVSVFFLSLQFGVSRAILAIESLVRRRHFQMGAHGESNLSGAQLTLADIFQVTALVAFILVAIRPYTFVEIPPYFPWSDLILAFLIFSVLGAVLAGILLFAASQAVQLREHRWIFFADVFVVLVGFVVTDFVELTANWRYAPFVTPIVGVFLSGYLFVFLVLSALNMWRAFELEPEIVTETLTAENR